MLKYLKGYIILVLLINIYIFLTISCYQAPVTGRSQFIIISESEEIKMGLVAYEELLKKEKISKNKAYNTSVTRVGHKMQLHLVRPIMIGNIK